MPSHQDLLQAYLQSGLREHAQGNVDAARDAYQQALSVAPDHPDALNLLGTALLQLGQPELAVARLERAARARRNDPGVLGNLAQAYFAVARYEEAGETFRKASRLDPRQAQFPMGVANSLAMQGRLSEAESLLRRLASRHPGNALVWFNLGNVLRDLERPADAADCFVKALAIDPRHVDAHNNLGGVLQKMYRFEDAEAAYRATIALAPDYPVAKCNLASVLIDVGRSREAEAVLREAIAAAPEMGEAHAVLGAALGHQGRLREALAQHREAARLSPTSSKAVETYMAALIENGYVEEGLRWLDRALELKPDSSSAHQRASSALIGYGYMADGWAAYDHRPAYVRFHEKYPEVALSRMLPPDLDGKHLCLLREQGLGDEIFFLRYAPLLKAAGARLTYRASNKIGSLLTRLECLGEVLAERAPLPQADAVMLLGDLPHALSAHAASAVPARVARDSMLPQIKVSRWISVFWPPLPRSIALRPLESCVAAMRKRLAGAGAPPYVALSWRGGTPPREQRSGAAWMLYKEIGIEPLAEALREVPATFIVLQRNLGPGEVERFSRTLGREVHDFSDLNEDLESMLAALALMEEYIGVSNTNMHLRAAAGRTARVLVPRPAEWRWMAAGASSPWFPGFSLYRQSLDGDWRPALAALGRDLAAVLK
jgi:tetratricopeptide (TPR) repeat protein